MLPRCTYLTAAMLVGCSTAALGLAPTMPSSLSTSPKPELGQDSPGGFVPSTSRPPQLGGADTVCYPNCDGSAVPPCLTPNDFACFLAAAIACLPYANCDGVGGPCPTPNDFQCFITAFSMGCGGKECFPP
jgi:hypothetical protein